MKIKYVEYYNELVSKYGEEDGLKKYKSFLRSSTLETYIIKFGEKRGTDKFNNKKKSGISLEKMIEKYGEKDGTNRYNNWLSKIRQDLPNFIKRYGEKDGLKKYNEFKDNCIVKTKIKENPNSKYNNRLHNTRYEFFLEENNGDINKAKKQLIKRQRTSDLKSFIKKHGLIEGEKKYKLANKKKSNNIKNFIRLYGDVEGNRRYFNYIKKLKYIHSEKYYLDKYGEIEGKVRWVELINKKTNNFINGQSKIGDEFCNNLFNEIKKDVDDKYYFYENEYKFFIHDEEYKIIQPDFLIKESKIVVEFYGDYWHRNPEIYNDDISKIIREKDEERIKKIESLGYIIYIIWEKEYRLNKIGVIKNLSNKIINKIK